MNTGNKPIIPIPQNLILNTKSYNKHDIIYIVIIFNVGFKWYFHKRNVF